MSTARKCCNLSVALCVLNDTYREAERLGVKVEGVAVEADGNFDAEWHSTGIEYCVTLDSIAPADALDLLRASVDDLARRSRGLSVPALPSGGLCDVVAATALDRVANARCPPPG